MNRFDATSPLDYRYYGDNPAFFTRLQPYVSETAYINYILKVELALVRLLARHGICPPTVVREVEAAIPDITPDEVYEEERRVHHNIRAIANCIRKRVSPESRPFVHLFATSADIMDTATALRYKELVRDVLLPDLITLEETLIDLARTHSHDVQIGRTHGQHAVPTTFGYAIALYVSRIGSRIQAIDAAHHELRGQLSGAVGAFNSWSIFDPDDPSKYESELLHDLGLKPSATSVSTQIVEPESLTDLTHSVVSCFSVLANLADDIRHLIRSEIAELIDTYSAEEVGSSTMPHKMNPKNFENVKSLWKAFMPRMITVYMDQISEHQRDLTNSASGRFLPELFTGFSYAVLRMAGALEKIETNTAKMKEHIEVSKQFVVAEPLYIMLALQGYPDAYDEVMKLSREGRRSGVKLMDLAWQHPELSKFLEKLPKEHKAILEDPSLYVGDAPARTIATCDYWEMESDRIKRLLANEKRDSQLQSVSAFGD
ncbi:MAG TPA: lyase family protein [Nitrososphaera sp.]|jgi:adenylosuccinate lyase|nr:lyase family protein [Nitrososphaera sp.]